ncbi:MAG: HAMP domain-containing histidine kinase [Acidobacteria bacterium]|nr:HAMP domain-containing histidine kinase [Acidobacteriota bacterium]
MRDAGTDTDKALSDHTLSESPSARVAERDAGLESQSQDEAAAQARAHLISNLVHDLRTPLVSIRGYTKMILDERAGSINNTQREYLTIVSENTNRLVQMLNSLMQAAATHKLRFETVDLRTIWQELLPGVRPRAQERSITLTEQITAEPLFVVGDKQRLAEVFLNLLSNSIKFAGQRGTVDVQLFSRDGEATVVISDTGVGIPAELLQKFLSRPVQPEIGGFPREGLGVGLSLLRDLIRLHGGQVAVSSKEGEGIAFVITLPIISGE